MVGLATVLAVLVGPIAAEAERHLWAHMVQHVVLMVVSAPLLVLGGRRAIGVPSNAWYGLAVGAVFVHAAAVWVWHLPGAFEAAVDQDVYHAALHGSFLGTALLLWWVVLGEPARSTHGAGVLALFLTALQGGALGAFMMLASAPWYPSYDHDSAGLTALEDQQLAGVIMWAPAGLVYLAAAVAIFASWLRHSDRFESEPVLAAD